MISSNSDNTNFKNNNGSTYCEKTNHTTDVKLAMKNLTYSHRSGHGQTTGNHPGGNSPSATHFNKTTTVAHNTSKQIIQVLENQSVKNLIFLPTYNTRKTVKVPEFLQCWRSKPRFITNSYNNNKCTDQEQAVQTTQTQATTTEELSTRKQIIRLIRH